jgi:enoyl-CoA hydratase/carnithine racemase
MSSILYDVADGVATVTLNKPEKLNAVDDAMMALLWETMARAAADSAVRVIVLTGAGRAFCAGGDVTSFGGLDVAGLTTKMPRPFDMNRRPDYQTRHSLFPAIPKPIIAMINGPAAGLGLLYAMFCDIRFAAEGAAMTTAFARRGLAAEYGFAWIMTRLIGQANTLDLLLSGRRFTGAEAFRMGLVNQVHPTGALEEATHAYAREMAAWCSPAAMRTIKAQIYEVPFETLAESVQGANRDMLVHNASEDFKEGTRSFLEKRPPRFPPL